MSVCPTSKTLQEKHSEVIKIKTVRGINVSMNKDSSQHFVSELCTKGKHGPKY